MLKAVLDTNQFVSSLLSKSGTQAQILSAWQTGSFQLVISPAIIAEITRVVAYPKISAKYGITEMDVNNLIALLRRQALLVEGNTPVAIIEEDPMDNRILACALEGQADCIVSGDRHLLKLSRFQNIPIISGRAFIQILQSL